jgi:hypothetical protein
MEKKYLKDKKIKLKDDIKDTRLRLVKLKK